VFFAHFRDGEGCQSYIVGCEESCAAAIIDPALDQVDRYVGEIGKHGLRVRYVIDTHTHAVTSRVHRRCERSSALRS
jgi:glyoxylase-like metal-dependent hydrolase (beta-lactamase superfamily II)